MNHPLAKVLTKLQTSKSKFERSYHVLYAKGDRFKFPQTEIIGDTFRVLAEPAQMEVPESGITLFPTDGTTAPNVHSIWPAQNRAWKCQWIIPSIAHSEIKAIAAAATTLGTKSKKHNSVRLVKCHYEWDTTSVLATLQHVCNMRMRVPGTIEALTDEMKDKHIGVSFNPQYLLEALNPKGDTRIRFDDCSYPALIDDPNYPDAWQIILMPTTR